MPNQRYARPVSGEIMTSDRTCAVLPRRGLRSDFVDAEFETLGDIAADKLDGQATYMAATAAAQCPPAPGMAMLAKQETERPPFGTVPAGPVFWITGITAAAVAFWISGGHALFHPALP